MYNIECTKCMHEILSQETILKFRCKLGVNDGWLTNVSKNLT